MARVDAAVDEEAFVVTVVCGASDELELERVVALLWCKLFMLELLLTAAASTALLLEIVEAEEVVAIPAGELKRKLSLVVRCCGVDA